MGIMCAPRNSLLPAIITIKVVSTPIDADEERRSGYFQSCRAGRLSHRDIVTIHDLGEHEEQRVWPSVLAARTSRHGSPTPTRMSLAASWTSPARPEGLNDHAHGVDVANIFMADGTVERGLRARAARRSGD